MSWLRLRFALFFFVVAGLLAYMAWQEGTLALSSTSQPEMMSLKQLLERGAHGNPNIQLTDFFAAEDYMIYDGGDEDGGWHMVWVPLVAGDVARSDKKLPSNAVRAILCSKRVHDPDELTAVCEKSVLPVLVLNQVSGLPNDIQWMLKSHYPDVDISKCVVLETGREPGNLAWLLLVASGSVLAVIVGLVVLFPEHVFRLFAPNKPNA